jgi:hypothetical protein
MSKKLLDIADNVTPTADDAFHITKTRKELGKEKLEKLIKEETRLVKGIFQFFENPGGSHRVMVKKYPGIPMFDKVMTDGMEYEIPLYVARHLNGIDVTAEQVNGRIGSCSYPVHGFISKAGELNPSAMGDAPGFSGIPVPIVGIEKRIKRFGFQSLEFAGAM